MDKNVSLKVSVRKLVEFVAMGGSIDSRFVGTNIMQEGTKTHQRLQGSRGEDYEKEVHLSMGYPYQSILLQIEGRCDGIYRNEKVTIIEEIKTTARDLTELTEEDFPTYWAQVKVYAYIYSKQQELEEISVRLLFAKRESLEERLFTKTYSLLELEEYVEGIVVEYMDFMGSILDSVNKRNETLKKLSFPFPSYRKGQKDLAKAVFKTIKENKRLFAKAATGIGKTISTIYPTLLAIGENKGQKMIYLTAKTVTRQVAEEAFQRLVENGLHLNVVTITAKEKVCFQEEVRCQKEFCPFADGYYDRLKAGLKDILANELIMSRQVIEAYSRKHMLCPFEFSLDLAMYADAIICDYNYFFDPKVRLQRWSEFHRDTIVLIDEAHNLADRAREMYSASISKSTFLQTGRIIKNIDKELYGKLKAVNDGLLEWKKELLEKDLFVLKEKPHHIVELVAALVEEYERWLKVNPSGVGYEEVLTCFYDGQDFVRVAKEYNGNFNTIVTIHKSEVHVKLACLDPSAAIRSLTKKAYATVFFSATMQPLGYYQTVLGGEKEDYHISIDSPFKAEQLAVYGKKVSTKYRDRDDSIEPIVRSIISTFHSKRGNYLVFFPSYEYLLQVYDAYMKRELPDHVRTIIQQPAMTEADREIYLSNFQARTDTLIGFAVLGGIFAEGIDLVGDRLNGVGIIGVGLPKITLERDVMKQHFQDLGYNGFDFAYVYPGMNKIQQAGGRLIRSEMDTGFILLIDDRYYTPKYRSILPPEWQNFIDVRG
ncbi:Rad3-related DNA helicase [Bacillus tianshenii]|uniref:Rad3-related DNA helicase n=1 Tax=Sutcliffiella tianshenii TaxID=1463404 RepID=A0ABS2P734_9BACI|nr:ATP-dependent DNA helicase [Bacillus tianshenii]MBM7622220.1 Rad3-related DNA helicase [Bacillus tianshenii]